ncbi:MAG: hypothetical protein ACHP91_15010, partial [Burkholderiales bacterium]
FAVNLIPHTLAATTLGELAAGARVNLEADMVALPAPLARLAERKPLRITSVDAVGADWRSVARVVR